MPPKAKITRALILKAGFDIVRREGEEALNVRSVAAALECSTRPVLYYFESVEALRWAIYRAADGYHSEYIARPLENADNPMLSIGLRYIMFAEDEKNLFRFLFQSGRLSEKGIAALTDNEELAPVYEIMRQATGISEGKIKDAFGVLFLVAHGIATLLANNGMNYDAEYCSMVLSITFDGIIEKFKGEII